MPNHQPRKTPPERGSPPVRANSAFKRELQTLVCKTAPPTSGSLVALRNPKKRAFQ